MFRISGCNGFADYILVESNGCSAKKTIICCAHNILSERKSAFVCQLEGKSRENRWAKKFSAQIHSYY